MPTWPIVQSRHWKAQVPVPRPAVPRRHLRCRGHGRSDRPIDRRLHRRELAADAVAVLDAAGVERAVLAGLSMGAGYALRLAAVHPDRVLGAVLIGEGLPVGAEPRADDRASPATSSRIATERRGLGHLQRPLLAARLAPVPEFFFGACSPSRTRPSIVEDFVGWILQTDPERIIEAERRPRWSPSDEAGAGRGAACAVSAARSRHPRPGRRDHGLPARGALAAIWGAVVAVDGGGHGPHGRHPVLVNLLIATSSRRRIAGTSGTRP